MKHNEIVCFINDNLQPNKSGTFSFADKSVAKEVFNFHKSIPGYEATPLACLSSIAARIGVKRVMVKDESKRFNLNAFKVLGASYGIANYLRQTLDLKKSDLTFDNIISFDKQLKNITFVTATDGNHGRAVSWIADKIGCNCVVYLPKGSSEARLDAIARQGAKTSITDFNYDETVAYAKKMSDEKNWVLLQDTSWPGYEKTPTAIMQGYSTLVTEYLQQQDDYPTHVFLQAGVGSFAAAVLAFLSCYKEKQNPVFIVVEPAEAPCLFNSMKLNSGKEYRIEGDLPTIMAGLACGEPSHLGLQVLKQGAAAFIKCSDKLAEKGMRILGAPLPGDQRIISGESGAVTFGLLFELLTNKKYTKIKNSLGLDGNSKVLLFSTEGDTDPKMYYHTVWS